MTNDPSQQGAADTSARVTVTPEPPFDPSARGSRVQQRNITPNASPAAHRPSERVQLVDKLGEIVGILALFGLAWHGKLDGLAAAGFILAILGVNSGFRTLGARIAGSSSAAGLGVVGILAMQGAEILHHVARAGLVALALVVTAGLSGCPKWQRVSCPASGVHSCVRDQPHYCAASRELTPLGDEPCGAQGRACAIDDAGVAWCAPAVDGGAR